jgi:predicted RNase H-like HicB family nuclease
VMRYAVVIEMAGANYSAYVPDLPGCVATGETREEAEREIREAMRFILRGLGRMACRHPNRGRL